MFQFSSRCRKLSADFPYRLRQAQLTSETLDSGPCTKLVTNGLTPFHVSASIEICLARHQGKTPNR